MLTKTLLILVLLVIAYILVINLALNLPITQTLINKARPEKFTVSWKRGWSLYPFTIHIREISANGQMPSMQWQVYTPAAYASISFWPLVQRTASIQNLEARDIVYKQRPRSNPAQEYATLRGYFPVIENRKPDEDWHSTGTKEKTQKRGWKISLTHVHATGTHQVWIHHVQSVLDGDLKADIAAQTRNGLFSLDSGEFDVTVKSLLLNGDREISKNGLLKGTLSISPHVPRQNKRLTSLACFKLDASLEIDTNSLAFLNFYVGRFQGMEISGSGSVKGRLKLETAKLQPGTDLTASARKLSVKLLSHKAKGDGTVRVSVSSDPPDLAEVSIGFENLKAFPPESDELLFCGKGLSLTGKGTATVIAVNGQKPEAKSLALSIPSVEVPDLKTYQQYIPEQLPFTLNGGHGRFHVDADLSHQRLRTSVNLTSDSADIEMKGYRFTTHLDFALQANSASLWSQGIDLAGTNIRLKKAMLSSGNRTSADSWHAFLGIEKGRVAPATLQAGTHPDLRQLLKALKEKTIVEYLDSDRDTIKLTGNVSDLRWISIFFNNPYNLAIHGSGEMKADIAMASGQLDRGTRLKIDPKDLRVDVLEYATRGIGDIVVTVEKGGERPDLKIDISLTEATLQRLGQEKAMVDKADIFLRASGKDLDWGHPEEDIALHLKIPFARVKDMSVYNQYLPEQSVFQLTGGQADLFADVKLEPESARGIILLETRELLSSIEDQDISGKLTANIKLSEGMPRDMVFDISGSTLTLDEVTVTGAQKNFERKNWRMQLDLTKGHAVWMDPTRVDMEAKVFMVDTRPLAAVLSNYRGRYGWIDRILTVENVKGNAKASMSQDQILISNALIQSDDIDVGAKGRITESGKEGVIFLRYKKVKGLLKINNGKKNFDIFNVRKKFDTWVAN